MNLASAIKKVSYEYLLQKDTPFKANSLAKYIRVDTKKIIESIVGKSEAIKVDCSPGKGQWAEIPWFGIFLPECTTSASSGVYIVYLFSANFENVYLSLAQGVTEVRDEFKKSTEKVLKNRSELICVRIPEYADFFSNKTVDLRGISKLAKDYEPSIAFHKSYQISSLPNSDELNLDLKRMVNLYQILVSRGGIDNASSTKIDNEKSSNTDRLLDEQRRYRRHRKIERNSLVSKRVKEHLGYICQGCELDFKQIYGSLGDNYIEAHHLTPLHTLKENEVVRMDPEKDFAVLCANCHRMVHRQNPVMAVDLLRKLPGVKALRSALAAIQLIK